MGNTMNLEGDRLNRAVARKLNITDEPLPNYAQDLLSAFDLAERVCLNKLDQRYLPFRLFRSHNGSYKADFSLDNICGSGYGRTAPEAICRAVLDAFYNNEPEDV